MGRFCMDREKVLRWMIEFGMDWVATNELDNTWADLEISWEQATKDNYIERRYGATRTFMRLTPHALKLLKK